MNIQLTEKEKINIRLESLRDAKRFLEIWAKGDVDAQCRYIEELSTKLRSEMQSEINRLNYLINDDRK